jgi:WD40 repeat protein
MSTDSDSGIEHRVISSAAEPRTVGDLANSAAPQDPLLGSRPAAEFSWTDPPTQDDVSQTVTQVPGDGVRAGVGARVAPGSSSAGTTDPGVSPTGPNPAAARPPRFLANYELLEEVARGGMGLVYRARQLHLGRIVALKLIRDPSLATYSELRRFRAEAEAVAQLDHPHIVPIYEVGQADDQPFFSMKLVEGGNLTRHAERLKSVPRTVAGVMAKVARAVHYAHQRAILHRDLKPSNILLDERDEPYVTDFGLAKRIETAGGGAVQTVSGMVMGTPAYMPPEQARGGSKSLTTAADVYSLGATLYELLTGRPPFAAETVPEILRQVVELEPPRPRTFNPVLDKDLETICLKCLEKEPTKRYGSALAVAEDLEAWCDGRPILARPATRWERLNKWARRRPEIAGLGATIVLLCLTGLGLVFWQWNSAVVANAGLRRSLYVSDMKLGEQAFANSQFRRVKDLVDAHAEERDLRGFEWYYLRAAADAEPMAISAHRGAIFDVRFSPDSKLLATAGQDKVVRLWDAETGAAVGAPLAGHASSVACLDFHPDGMLLASGSHDCTVRIWNVAAQRTVTTFEGFASPPTGVAFNPDGLRLAVVGSDMTVTVLDLKTRRELLRKTLGHQSSLPGYSTARVTFDRSGKRLIVMSSLGPYITFVLDAATGEVRHELEGWSFCERVVSPDDRRLFLGFQSSVRVYDLNSGEFLYSLEGHTKQVDNLVVAAHIPLLVTGASYFEVLKVWDLDARRELRSEQSTQSSNNYGGGMDLSPDGRMLAEGLSNGNVLIWYNLLGRKSSAHALLPEQSQNSKLQPQSLALDRLGRTAAAADHKGNLTIWDLSTGRTLRSWKGPDELVYGVSFSPDGRSVASACGDGLVRVWSAGDGALVHTLRCGPGQVFAVDYDRTGPRLAAAGDDRKLVLWSTQSWSPMWTVLEAHEGPIHGVAFSPDGATVASASGDQTIKLWDANSGTPIKTLTTDRRPDEGPTGPIFSVAFRPPDGRQLVGAFDNGMATVWDARTGAVVHTLRGHVGRVYRATFSPDGRRVITAGADHNVKLWDAFIGKETLELRHGAAVSGAAITPDGFRLLAAAWNGTVTVWDARPIARKAGEGITVAEP